MSFTTGGIVTPDGLLQEKETASAPTSAPASAPSSDPSGTTTSGSSSQNANLKPEVRAFLDLIAYAEGAHYDVMFTGKRFSSFADHPRIKNRSGGLVSDAAGRYQFLASTWDGVKKKLGLKDFSPASQDLAAVQLIRGRSALKYVEQGTKGLKQALDLLSYEWASFPPARYPQPVRSFQDLTNQYIRFLLKYQKQTPPQQAAAVQPVIKDKVEQKPKEESQKGTEIIVELGFSLSQMTVYHFIHTGTSTSRESLDTTVFEGAMIRWLLARRLQNTAYTNITLRQLAKMVCRRYGLKLAMEGNGPTYQHLDQTGITDYELLLRESRAIGYSIREDKDTLILKPYRPEFTGFVITRDILQSIQFSDRASVDRSPTSGTTVSTPTVPVAEPKTRDDRKTGQVVQTRVEDTTGTGVKTSQKTAITGAGFGAVRGTTILDTSVTGLPKQEIGAIDLADGKAEAQVIADEAKRVKGFESQASLVTTPEILTIVPGSIIATSEEVAPLPFAREWRVGSVKHSLSTSGMRSQLQFYSPQAAKTGTTAPTNSSSTDNSTAPTTPTTELKPGGFVVPCSGRTGDGLGAGRRHAGIDIANVQGTPIFASCDGLVYKTQIGCRVGDDKCYGGYGNNIVLQHTNGYYTRYAHLHEINVAQGQKVRQGQQIGTMGTTGYSTSSHLHWEIRKGSSFGQAIGPSEVGCKVPGPYRNGSKY
jgi:muramidase (phage lysozyme)